MQDPGNFSRLTEPRRRHLRLPLTQLSLPSFKMNLNLSASVNIFKLIFNPALCLPHATVGTFNDLPLPLGRAFKRNDGSVVDIKAVVLDKDDCFAVPETNEVYVDYKEKFAALKAAYPGRRLLIVSNTAGALGYDRDRRLAADLEKATGVVVLPHKAKKPGCGDEIMTYFKGHPETGVVSPSQVAVVGDRLSTDMMLANMMGGWGIWVRNGVVPLSKKSVFSRLEHRLAPFLLSRGYSATEPQNPFE
ncbi:hypothetical protein RB597_000798 [Gaeumannomyces tritici]